MNLHLLRLELIEFLTDHCLVLRRKPRPRLVRSAIVVMRLRHFDVIVETNDLTLLKLLNRRTKAQLSNEHLFTVRRLESVYEGYNKSFFARTTMQSFIETVMTVRHN